MERSPSLNQDPRIREQSSRIKAQGLKCGFFRAENFCGRYRSIVVKPFSGREGKSMKSAGLLILVMTLVCLPGLAWAQTCPNPQKLGADFRMTDDASWSMLPSLSWTGSEFGVGWCGSNIYFARVSSSGTKLGTDLRVTSDASISWYPSLSWTGSEFGVSWQDYRDANYPISDWSYEIYFARVSSSVAKLGAALPGATV